MRAAAPSGKDRRGARGQGVVEFALILPVFLLMLLGMIEFGFIFTHDLTIEYATREGARAGSALDNGGGTLGCAVGQSPNWQTVDPLVIAAVERALASPGSQVVIANVSKIIIYKANPNTGANDQGLQDVWTYSPGGGPIPSGDTQHLDFVDSSFPNTNSWKACSRTNASPNVEFDRGECCLHVPLPDSARLDRGLLRRWHSHDEHHRQDGDAAQPELELRR